MPLDLLMGLPPEERNDGSNVDDYVANQQEIAESAYRIAREQLRSAAQRRKNAYDARVKANEFGVGDWVWYYYRRRYSHKSPKWQRCYVGPYLIICAIPPVNYVTQKTKRSTPFVTHIDKLKKCMSPPSGGWTNPSGNEDTREATAETVDYQKESASRDSRLRPRPITRPPRYFD